ncbi:MAG: CHAT domain-containing protein [Candidatus Competibacteraceae bacterium]|nr:MAG: CHAT domain-containing protein [Candidatus Competibacteraceae bacterium]
MPFNPYLSWRSSLAGMIGLLLWSLGAVPTGLSAEALPQSATAPPNNQTRQVDALLQRAEADQALGQYRNALAALRTAQSLAEPLADPARHATVLGELGETLWRTGATAEARHALERSVALARQANALPIAAAGLNHLGNLAADQGDAQSARVAWQESLSLARQVQDPALITAVLINQARLAAQERDSGTAETLLAEAARQTQTLPASHDQAYYLLAIGQLRRTLPGASVSQQTQAWQHFTAAAAIARQLEDQRSLSYALGYQAQWQRDAGRSTEALALYRQAVFAAQQANAPELLYRWQWPIGRLLKAQGDHDGAILAYRQAVVNLQTIRQDFAPDRAKNHAASLQANSGDAFTELADLLLQRAAGQAAPAARDADLRAARDTMEALKTAEVRDYFRDDCITALQSRTVTLDRPPPHTAVLYPILLPNRLELLLSTPDNLEQITVRVDRNTFTSVVREFRRTLEKRTSREYLPPAQQLYGWLIRPLQTTLDAGRIETLVIVPDGPLRTIPLAALHDGQDFLIRRYAIATTPGLTLTDLRPIPRHQIQPLLAGLTQAVQGFPALDYVQEELAAIHTAYGGKVLENETFRLANLQQALKATPYSIVHIATHGQFVGDVRNTFLLTFDDKLTLDRLERLIAIGQYRDQPVELLTLSACQTAAGDDRAALGLAGVAVKAGARSVLATLWLVNDQASGLLATEFYQQLQRPDQSKVRALQQAQVRLLADRRYQHPGYWSPFLLIGNWL